MKNKLAGKVVVVVAVCAALAAADLIAQPFAVAQRRMIMRGGMDPSASPAPTKGGRSGSDKNGLHLPQDKRISFNFNMSDGAGFNWDIQYYGTVGQGNNYAYSGGMYLHVNNNNFQGNGQGWSNAAGDEVEIGPWNWNNLVISRRIKVFKDQGLARWLDILENNTGSDITVPIQIYTNTNYQVGKTTSSSGGAACGENDFGFVTEPMGGNNVPSLLHVFCDPKLKTKPTVQVNSNQIYIRQNVTVPTGKFVCVVHFEAQGNTPADLVKQMKEFKSYKVLKDLPSNVRRAIVNFTGIAGIADIELERSDTADTIIQSDGKPLLGNITNESFTLETFCGTFKIAAADLIGMAVIEGREDLVTAVLKDGQVLCAKSPSDKLAIEIPAGGKLQVPFDRIRQWSYKISDARPGDEVFGGPNVVLRTGDRLGFDPAAMKLSFRTAYGTVDLNPKDLLEISLDNSGSVHRATFLNGSTLGGFLEPAKIPLSLKIGAKADVPRDLIARIRFSNEDKPNPLLARVVLVNGDELFGKLSGGKLKITTEFGDVTPEPGNIKSFGFSRTHQGRVMLTLWNGSALNGQIEQGDIPFQIVPGPELKIYCGQFQSLECTQALPPDEIQKKVEQLVAKLGAESYNDRQEATDALVKLGPAIVPLLQKHVANRDPEVRQRVEAVLEKLGGKPAPPAPEQPEVEEEGAIINGPCLQIAQPVLLQQKCGG